jgi:PHD finger-like domain-containing protein 5A
VELRLSPSEYPGNTTAAAVTRKNVWYHNSRSILQQNTIMAKHHPDLVMCRKQPGIATLADHVKSVMANVSFVIPFVNPSTIVHVCEECNFGTLLGRCVVCGGGVGVTDAYYCRELCTVR